MKRNVDLTENRFFSNDGWLNNMNTSVWTLGLLTGEKFPWNAHLKQINSDDDLDLDHQRKSIIAIGNKTMRAKVKEYRQMDSLDYCDCCGKRMNLKPWNWELGICHQCNEYYQKQEDKCKWRKKEEIINAVIRTA